MRLLVLIAAILVANACPLMAKEPSAVQQLLDSARMPADLFQGYAHPFDLEVDFTAQFKVPAQGHVSLMWNSKDQWWSKVDVAGFNQITIRNGEMEYTSRNFPYTPPEVSQLFYLLQIEKRHSEFIPQKSKNRIEDGVSMTCIQAEREDAKSEVHAICLEAASHELLSNEWPEPPDLKKREQFADYFDFEGGRYPRSLEFLVNSNRTLSANETSVSPAPFEPALLVPPKGAIERRMCPGMKHPEGIERFRSIYKGAGTPEGEITVSFSVLTDGSVDDIQIIRSGGKTVDQMTVAAVKRFKYKPAMCGDEPVVSDMQVTYRTRP